MRGVPRTSTMIALRARRQALSIARDIAYPHVDVQPRVTPVPSDDPTPRRREPMWYALWPTPCVLLREPEPAPWWIGWLVAGCLLCVAVAGLVIYWIG